MNPFLIVKKHSNIVLYVCVEKRRDMSKEFIVTSDWWLSEILYLHFVIRILKTEFSIYSPMTFQLLFRWKRVITQRMLHTYAMGVANAIHHFAFFSVFVSVGQRLCLIRFNVKGEGSTCVLFCTLSQALWHVWLYI